MALGLLQNSAVIRVVLLVGLLSASAPAADEPKGAAKAPATAPAPQPPPAPKPLTVGPYRGAEVGGYGILVHITKDQRAKGLKYVKEIPADRGMVWVYMDKTAALFDTRDYLVKVDLVFIADNGAIQAVVTADPAPAGTKDADLAPWTVKGRIAAADVAKATLELPHTRFVVALAEGEGLKFSKAWKPKMTKRFLSPDRNHRIWGFSNR